MGRTFPFSRKRMAAWRMSTRLSADTTLGDDVGGTVAALNGHHGLGPYQPEHGEQIDHRVGKPRNDSDHLRHADLSRDLGIGLLAGGAGEPDEKLVHDVEEGDHGCHPVKPASAQLPL